jgi:hypothetical protein
VPVNLRKFVNPQFLRSVDPSLIARLLDRHRHALIGLDTDALHAQPEVAGDALTAFFAGPEETYPAGLVADLHRIAELGNAKGLRLILAQAARLGRAILPEASTDGSERRQDAKHVALRMFLDHPAVFDAASDMLALAARSSLDEYAGLAAGVEVDLGAPAREAFSAQLAAMLEADLCGSYCRLGWYADADEVNLVISHGSIVKTTPIVKHDEERVVTYRDAEQAVLSYSAATGRLKMGDIPKARRAGVAEIFAKTMLGRPGFFAAEGAQDLYTLEPIERNGPDFRFHHAFDRGIRQVKVIEAQAGRPGANGRWGEGITGARFVARDFRSCALAQLADIMRGERLGTDWRLQHVVIRIALEAGSERPEQLTAKIKPPAKAVFPRHRHEERVLNLLRFNGLVRDRFADLSLVAAE